MIEIFKPFYIRKPNTEDEFNTSNGELNPTFSLNGELKVGKRVADRFLLQGLTYDKTIGLQTKYMIRGVDSTSYAAETVFDSSKSAFKKIRTVSANSNFNMTNGGRAGQELYLQIDNDTTANRTITFGGKFKVSGTLTGSTNATAMLQFISNGTNFMEVSRVTGINQ